MCIKLPVHMIPVTRSSATGCAEALFMEVPLELKGHPVQYVASWSWDTSAAEKSPWTFTATGGEGGTGSGPYGEEQWSTTALTAQNTGVNIKPYEVPHGYGAWFVAAGGGPLPCTVKTGSATAWMWRSRSS